VVLIEKNESTLTDSNKDEVTIGLLAPELLIFVRMGAPNPIDESWRLSEIVFSKPTKAPPHIKRISVVSICIIMRFCYRHVTLKTVKNKDGFMMPIIPIQIVTKCRIFMPYAQPVGCYYLVVRKCI
jgi:hypothetical protein